MARNTWLGKTRWLLRKDGRNLMQIAKAADVNYFWLREFKAGRIANPGIVTVQKLHDTLSR